MIISKRRIRSVETNLNFLQEGENFFLATPTTVPTAKISRSGFSTPLSIGEVVLPSIVGKTSRFNAEGSYTLLRHLPKEVYYQERYWTWTQWKGKESEEHSKVVYIRRERFQREPILPPGEELTLVDIAGRTTAVSRMLTYEAASFDQIKHLVNLMLELYGECEVLRKDLSSILPPVVRRLNWELIPPGEQPFPKVKARLSAMLEGKSINRRAIYMDRVTKLSRLGAQLIATGHAGFGGYLVFSTPNPELFLLESLYYGNATYILRSDWVTISMMSKAEILAGSHHHDRIIHKEGWQDEVARLF